MQELNLGQHMANARREPIIKICELDPGAYGHGAKLISAVKRNIQSYNAIPILEHYNLGPSAHTVSDCGGHCPGF